MFVIIRQMLPQRCRMHKYWNTNLHYQKRNLTKFWRPQSLMPSTFINITISDKLFLLFMSSMTLSFLPCSASLLTLVTLSSPSKSFSLSLLTPFRPLCSITSVYHFLVFILLWACMSDLCETHGLWWFSFSNKKHFTTTYYYYGYPTNTPSVHLS